MLEMKDCELRVQKPDSVEGGCSEYAHATVCPPMIPENLVSFEVAF